MKRVIKGVYENGEVKLDEKPDIAHSKIKIIFLDAEESTADTADFWLQDQVRIRTRGFKIDRETLYAD